MGRGVPVHAASFIPRRLIVLEQVLLTDEPLLRLILTHEILHFAWTRLGNQRRGAYLELLELENQRSARGELGESSAVAKEKMRAGKQSRLSTVWRHYACESFCDTGAWLLAGVPHHASFQLARQWRERRAAWFSTLPWLRV